MKEGYICRCKPKNRAERQRMYETYPFVIQGPFYGKDKVALWVNDGSKLMIDPHELRVGAAIKFFTSKQIISISLEVAND